MSYLQNVLFNSLSLSLVCLSLVCFSLALVCPSQSDAQATEAFSRSIEVIGTGKATAKPDRLVVEAFVNAEGETAKKVLGKFLKIKKSLEETINPMDFPAVEIEFLDSAFNTNLNSDEMMMGAADEMTADGYYLNQPIKIRIKMEPDASENSTLEMLSKLVDSAENIGVTFSEKIDPMMGYSVGTGTDSLASGDLTDRESLKSEATKAAFDNAREQAEKLAELAGGKLGKVIKIQATNIAGANSTDEYMQMMMGITNPPRVDSMLKIEVTQSLQVSFELID